MTAVRVEILLVLALCVAAVAACSSQDDATESTAPILSTTATPAPTTTTSADESTTSTNDATTTIPAPTTTLVPLDQLSLELVEVASGFDAPVLLSPDPDGGEDLIVEQPGRIVRRDSKEVVLDIRGDVVYGGERGLLGLAFHPDFAVNRLAYVNYIDGDGATRVEQFSVLGDGSFDRDARKTIMQIPQPARNHNGGMIAFGPDGYLWIAMGDGGASNDRFGNGQRADTLLGAMLRIAVGVEGVDTYAIPPDNPFADGVDGAPEVYWIGLRNPWRFSFDASDVWVADVGQNAIEEVNVAPAEARSLNFGWPVMEGTSCFQSSSCEVDPYVLPVTEFGRDRGCSVTGGYVYRGSAIPELDGEYFYSDYCGGFLASFSTTNGDVDWSDRVERLPSVSSFGVGGDGELYVIGHSGSVHRLEVSR
ncbi:MAG: PQQ-dependent sugar dehydrogenase [Acidimicrobiia bacterium]